MTDTWRAFILAVIEGLTEFLPVSSTGHMIVAMPVLGVDSKAPPWPVFLYFIQIGAILAVVIYFWRRLWRQALTPPEGGLGSHLFVKVGVAMIPGAIAGVALDPIMERYLETPIPVSIALIVGAIAMVVIETGAKPRLELTLERVSLKQALGVGLAQCLAVVPGTSRAMVTIMAGIAMGMPAAVAAELSFYLAIPTLCGAGLLRIVKHREEITADMAALLGFGFSVSFVVALLVIAGFMRYLQTRSLRPFAVYRVLMGVAVLAWYWKGR